MYKKKRPRPRNPPLPPRTHREGRLGLRDEPIATAAPRVKVAHCQAPVRRAVGVRHHVAVVRQAKQHRVV